MAVANQDLVFLGLDIGHIHTRAALFGVTAGRYCVLGQSEARTTIGAGQHLGEGVGEAVKELEKGCNRKLLNTDGSPIVPVRANGSGMDRIAISVSAGPALKTVVTGLTGAGSLRAGRALVESLPLDLVGLFGLGDLEDEGALVDRIVGLRPDLVVITGGETGGAITPLGAWIEIIRRVLLVLDESDRPRILYAGNPAARETAQRRLEPLAKVYLTANLLPEANRYDLLPAQAVINKIIVSHWMDIIPGLKELAALAEDRLICGDFGVNRMARFLSRPMGSTAVKDRPHGVMAVNLGAESVTMTVGMNGESLAVRAGMGVSDGEEHLDSIYRWMPEELRREAVSHYYHRRVLNTNLVPSTLMELAFEQACARHRLQSAGLRLSGNYITAPFDPELGWQGHFEPVIAGGEIFDRAPLPGQTMLMLLDGIQPRGVTTLVLDRFQILPLLGLFGETFPILPIHLLESDAFQNLGTVITAISPAPEGEKILSLQVIKEKGGDFSVDIQQGMLRRIVIQVNEPVVLVLKPEQGTDLGFGEPGLGGRLKVTGGALGIVIDARGRPLSIPDDSSERTALLQRWGRTLGAGE